MDSTLAKGLAVMEWLVNQPGGVRVADAAAAFDLPRSNVHRTLQTLVQCGWALQSESDSTYRPSLKLFSLGALVNETADLKSLLHPVLAVLASGTGETIHLAVLQDREIVYLDKFDSPLPVAAYSRVGGRAPAHCVASGKVLLAELRLDAASLAQRLGTLQAHTPQTITSMDALQADLAQTRLRGYGENREEWRTGVCGLGAVVLNARGEAVAAVGMSVPAIRFTRQRARELAKQVCSCALQASEALGFYPRALPKS
jgi:DNA-binding IclR family transcriptional regulator